MHVHLFERRRVKDFSIRDAIESPAACQTNGLEPCSLRKFFQHAEINFFEPRLQRTSQIAVPLLQSFFGSANRPQALRHFIRKHFAERRRLVGFGPGHLRAGAVMREVIELQAEAVAVGAAIKTHDVAKRAELLRLAVRGQAHDFVLVAKFQEAQILRHRAVKQSKRMWESYRPVDTHAAARAGAPHGAGEIAESVGGKQRGAFERRNEKAAREMRQVVLDAVELGNKLLGIGLKGCRQRSEEHTSELQSRLHLVCRLLLEKKKTNQVSNMSVTHRPYRQSHRSYI